MINNYSDVMVLAKTNASIVHSLIITLQQVASSTMSPQCTMFDVQQNSETNKQSSKPSHSVSTIINALLASKKPPVKDWFDSCSSSAVSGVTDTWQTVCIVENISSWSDINVWQQANKWP
jgi:hypothetical protein